MTGTPRDHTAMAATEPDVFIHSGDTIDADGPLEETVVEADGQVWGHPRSVDAPRACPAPRVRR